MAETPGPEIGGHTGPYFFNREHSGSSSLPATYLPASYPGFDPISQVRYLYPSFITCTVCSVSYNSN